MRSDRKPLGENTSALRALGFAMALSLVAVAGYSFSVGRENFVSTLCIGYFAAGAAVFVGGTMGFLFGIPRTLQQERNDGDGLPPSNSPPGNQVDYRANTNLEQISDWLTKILVGVGLTQLDKIKDGVIAISGYIAIGLGGGAAGKAFALLLVCYSTILGFFFGYLWTRLFLVGALRIADQAMIGDLVTKVEFNKQAIVEIKNQVELDAKAQNLVYRQLNPNQEGTEISQMELTEAILSASNQVKTQVFNQASLVRSENWHEADRKLKMERTIPIFQALIQSDFDKKFHRNHGQLGYALKDKSIPDYFGAEQELTIAIETREKVGDTGWQFYEMNRAICRVLQDQRFIANQMSDPKQRALILEDMRIAARTAPTAKIIEEDSELQKWLALNQVDLKSELVRNT